jgi:hypothetical protein
MNTLIKDGGPAFPVPDSHHANGQVQYGANGMTLRDWLAGQALPRATIGAGGSAPAIAARAYFIADAMLAAREKGQP